MPATKKQRLDILLTRRNLAPSRTKAQALIMAGDVFVNNNRADKPGMRYPVDAEIYVREQPRFVSRGGEKLDAALDAFSLDVTGVTAADVGASTGGFTDCLLQRGAASVYAIDVGYGQLAHRLRIDSRVHVMERTNARHLDALPERVSLAVIDASYISLRLILPAVSKWLTMPSSVVALIKPQFEAGKQDVSKGGVVKDSDIHRRVLHEILSYAVESGFIVRGLITSPIKGLKSGNVEFLVWLYLPDENESISGSESIDQLIEQVIE